MPKYRFRQIKIEWNSYLKLKSYCVLNDITLVDFYENTLNWFLNNHDKKDSSMIFRASYKKGFLLSMRFKELTINKIKVIAETNGVSEACIIYTALQCYFEKYF